MIQQFVNAVTVFLLAKFVLNDIPHAVLDNPTRNLWVSRAWEDMNEFDRRMMSNPEIQEGWGYEPDLSAPYDQVLAESISMKHITENQAVSIKKVLAGYFWIAKERAPDYVVNDVYDELQSELMMLERTGQLYEEGENLLGLFTVPSPSRPEKVIAIDSAMGLLHAGGVNLFEVEGSYIGHIIGRILDMLAIGDIA